MTSVGLMSTTTIASLLVLVVASLLLLPPSSVQSFPLAIRGVGFSSSHCRRHNDYCQWRRQPPRQSPSAAVAVAAPLSTTTMTTTTCLNNMLRDYASSAAAFSNNGDYYSSSSNMNNNYYDSSTNWRKNQGYNRIRPIPPELGGSIMNPHRDAETNPYYDPGWAQSVRRDSTTSSSSSSQGYGYGYGGAGMMDGGYYYGRTTITYPGMTNPRKTDKVYTNPTNPYYDPVWSQSYIRNDVPIRDADHTMYYAPGYDYRNSNNYYYNNNRRMTMMDDMEGGWEDIMMDDGYYGGGGGRYGRRGGMMGRMYAIPPTSSQSSSSSPTATTTTGTTTSIARGGWKKSFGAAARNGNSLMRTKKSTLFQGRMNNNALYSKISALRMSYYGDDLDWGGPPFDGPMIPPPPGYGRGMRPGMQGDYAGVIAGSGGPYGANQMNPNYYRRGGGSNIRRGSGGGSARPSVGGGGGGLGMGGQRGMMGGMPGVIAGVDPFVYPDSLRNAQQGPYFGRDNAFGRMSLKDMAQRSTQSFDAEVIKSMNNRANSRRNELGGGGSSFPVEAGGERRGTTTSTTSTSSQYVPLSSIYGPRSSPPIMDRSPPLNGGPPLPTPLLPIIEANAMVMGDLPTSVQTARSVRPSVVLVTSEGVRKENSQGSGFVVAFDDSAMEDEDDDNDGIKDRVFILTSAHVAPPGWKVSVTFPGDPDKQYPATVVGRKLSSDLALLCVETVVDEDDEYPFPPPLVLTNEDVSTDTNRANDDRVPTSEIGSPVYSFGYPMGVEGPTMTSGILSATTKGINYMDAPTGEEPSEISKSRPFEKTLFVITDAAMAGGMSGGPLVNSEGIVLAINALVRPDLRALGNYAVSALECETFLEKLEDKRSKDAGGSSSTTKRASSQRVNNGNSNDDTSDRSSSRRKGRMSSVEPQRSTATDDDSGVAGFRVMLYGYSVDKSEASKILRRVAGLDELRAENAMRSAHSFGAGVVDEFYVAESGGRERAVKAARKSADDLLEKLEKEGMMVEVEPLKLLK